MPLYCHSLTGCSPTPLAHYLKALGILRLVAEQADPAARGWWQDEAFHLATTLDRPELERFFLEEYRPTPMFNPWGARSGYYAGSSESSSRAVLQIIEKSKLPRLTLYRDTITKVRAVLKDHFSSTKPNEDGDKDRLIRLLRQTVGPISSAWMDTCVACLADDTAFPAIFGTGASEGSGSYMSAYMLAIERAVIARRFDHGLSGSLWGNPTPLATWDETFGHFLPAGVAGPWDLLLAFEGICLIRSAVTSTSMPGSVKWMSSPFYMAPVAAAYSTSAPQDEVAMNKGKKMPGRGEQWFPVWSSPSKPSELQTVFGQGRASIQRKSARNGAAMSLAIANLGVQRGIDRFVRYGYQQRNNLATHFAVPLGQCHVPEARETQTELLTEIHSWLERLRYALRKAKRPPSDIETLERQASGMAVSVLDQLDCPACWQSLLLTLAAIEAQLVHRHGFTVPKKGTPLRPIPPLSVGWLAAADDGSTEFRLASALAFQAADPAGHDPVRSHWLPLDPKKLAHGIAEFATDASGLRKDPRVVCHDLDPERDLLAIVQRRGIEAAHEASGHLPLAGIPRFYAPPADLAALIQGQVDLRKTTRLARAFMAIDRRTLGTARPIIAPASAARPPPLYGLFRLASLPWPLRRGDVEIPIRFDRAIVTRLAAGDLRNAGGLALRRLRASGLIPVLRRIAGEPALARRIALSLAFPVSPATATCLAATLTKPQSASNQS